MTKKQQIKKSKVKKARCMRPNDDEWEVSDLTETPSTNKTHDSNLLPNQNMKKVKSVPTKDLPSSSKKKRKKPVTDEWEVTDITETPKSTKDAPDDSNMFPNNRKAESILGEDSTPSPMKKRKKGSKKQNLETSFDSSELNLSEVGKEKVSLSDLFQSSKKLAAQTNIKKKLKQAKKLKAIPVSMDEPQVQKGADDADSEWTVVGSDQADPDENGKGEAEPDLSEDRTSGSKIKRKRGLVQRNEPSLNISEFNLNEVGKEKVSLNDLVKSSQKLDGQNIMKKQLDQVKQLKAIPVPLSKPQVQKIKRAAAYGKVCKEVSKWDSVVESNRTADQIIFPLKKPEVSKDTFDQQAETFVTKHPVEIAVNELLKKSDNVIDSKKPFTEAEQKILDAMSPHEAKLRMQELMKQRALMSYQQIKACRQNKIKSKKYRRLLKKEKLKKLMKEFEELEKTDAAAALEKVMEADKLRVLERVTLKHRNTGKWAKIQKLRAKYNPDARSVLKEDLSIGRQLKEKLPEVEKAITRLKTTMEQQDEEDEEKYMEEALIDEQTNPLKPDDEKNAEPDISEQWLVKPESLLKKSTFKDKNREKEKRPSSNKQEFVDVESITKSTALDSCKALNIISGDDLDGESEGNESDVEVDGINEAFADEEFIAEFREEREAQNKKPKGIDLFLPGWGSWTGPNIKDSEKKRRRFFIKAPEDDTPKKNTLGTVILNEERDKKVSSLQVSNLPFPFTNVTQFESHIRQPLGQNWNPQSSFQNLNAPKVIVRAGKIIDPIDAEDVLLSETKKDQEKEKPEIKRTQQLPLEAF